MKYTKTIVAALAVAMMAVPAFGVGYVELVPWDTLLAGGSASSHYAQTIEGQTAYVSLTASSSPQITKITELDGAQNASMLVTTAAWFFASGGQTGLSNANGFGISGDNLMFTDSYSDAVWCVDKVTGDITPYITKDQVIAYTGQSGASSLASNSIAPDGEMIWYEGYSDSILKSNGQGVITTLVADTELTTLQGNDSISGGFGFDASGKMYWGNNTNDAVYARAADGTLSQVFTQADVIAVTGETAAGFGEIFGAPDGMVYLYESTGDAILRFDPAAPVATLEEYISTEELENGPAETGSKVSTFGWYDGNLTFNRYNEYGLFVVPEPGTLMMLAFGGLALIRRR